MSGELIYEELYLFSSAYLEYYRLSYQLRLLDDLRAGISIPNAAADQETLTKLFQLPSLTKSGLVQMLEMDDQESPEAAAERKRLSAQLFQKIMELWKNTGELRKKLEGEEYRAPLEELRRLAPWLTDGETKDPPV